MNLSSSLERRYKKLIAFMVSTENNRIGPCLMFCWLRFCFPMQKVWVPSLVGELRSHMLLPQNQITKQKQCGDKYRFFQKGILEEKQNKEAGGGGRVSRVNDVSLCILFLEYNCFRMLS